MLADEIKKAGQAILNKLKQPYIASNQESLITLKQLDYLYNWIMHLKENYR